MSHQLTIDDVKLDPKKAAEKLFEESVTATEFEVPEGLYYIFKRPKDAKIFADWVGKYMTDLLATATAGLSKTRPALELD